MTTHTESQTGNNSRKRQLGASLAAGPLIWALHMSVVYPITSLTCAWGWFPDPILGLPGLRFVQLAVTAIAGGIVLVAGLTAFRHWRDLRGTVPADEPEAELRPFGAFLGVASNAVFLALIIVAVVPILAINPCAV